MKNLYKELELHTHKQFEVIDITTEIVNLLKSSEVKNGVVTIQSPHTTASVRLNNFEPLLLQDMFKVMYRIAPVDISYSHDLFELKKGMNVDQRTNGHSHIKAFLLGSSEQIIVNNGELKLGQNQNILFIEFDGGRSRLVQVSIMGE